MMTNKYILSAIYIIILGTIFSCTQDEIPKPRGELRLEYTKPIYRVFDNNCPYIFDYSNQANAVLRNNSCWYNLNYPKMKATIYLTYNKVENNLPALIKETEKLTYEHTIKATSLKSHKFMFPEKKVYGTLFELSGAAASNVQFYITDSTHHLLAGSLYFKVAPNPDSLLPAVAYIKEDIMHIIETTEWRN